MNESDREKKTYNSENTKYNNNRDTTITFHTNTIETK